MSTDNTDDVIEEAEYELIGRRHGRIQVEIVVPGEKHPINHGVNIAKAKKHPDGVQAFIEEEVRRIAARHVDPGLPEDEELPEKGTVSFDPRTRDGQRKEDILEPEERKGGAKSNSE